jgi:hypothetical protein
LIDREIKELANKDSTQEGEGGGKGYTDKYKQRGDIYMHVDKFRVSCLCSEFNLEGPAIAGSHPHWMTSPGIE